MSEKKDWRVTKTITCVLKDMTEDEAIDSAPDFLRDADMEDFDVEEI